MPAKKRYRSKSRRRASKRNRIASVYAPRPSASPDQMVVTMKYSERINLNSGIVAFTQTQFRAGSIFDPNFTGIGHQPLGHDQWSTIYQQYRVLGSKMTVLMNNNSTTNGINLAITPVETSGLFGQFSSMLEAPYTTFCQAGNENSVNTATLVNPYMSTKKMKGDLAAKYDKDFAANFGANPVSDWYWILGVENASGVTNLDVDLTVIIDYKVLMWDRQTLSQS